MTPAEARVDDPGSPHHSGTITAVNGCWAAVQWDTPTAHHIADLRLLPAETAQPTTEGDLP